MYGIQEKHRFLLQHVMKHGYIEFEKLTDLFHNFSQNTPAEEGEDSDESVEECIRTINEALNKSGVHMRIKFILEPKTKIKFATIINEVEDEVSKVLSKYSQQELSFFKRILEKIRDCNDNGGEFAFSDALNERDKTMGFEDCEQLLNQLIQDGWIAKKKQSLSFGVRTLSDLSMMLDQEDV